MTLTLRIVLIAAAVLIALYILLKIRASKLRIEDAVFWIGMAVVLLLFSLFPAIPDLLARLLGVQATYNFLYLFFIGLLLLRAFLSSLRIARMEQKITELAQEIALRNKRIDDLCAHLGMEKESAPADLGKDGETP